MKVIHYQRKSRVNANFSLEQVFADVRQRLQPETIIELRNAPFLSNGLLRRLGIVLDVFRFRRELVHVTGDINFAILGAGRRNCLLTVLDCGFVARSSGLKRFLLKWFWLTAPVKHASVITTISTVMKDEIVELSACNPEKVVVIPVAISEHFTFDAKVFNLERPTILHMGTAPNKNLSRVIEALSGLACRLVIVGNLSQHEASAINQYGIDCDNYVGIDAETVLRLYRECDILCFPSTYEGFGMPILEAQTTGRVVVTSHCSAMPEVAGEAAHFVDPLDPGSIRAGIEKVIADTEYREMLIRNGLENVKRFNPDKIAMQYLKLYQNLLMPRS